MGVLWSQPSTPLVPPEAAGVGADADAGGVAVAPGEGTLEDEDAPPPVPVVCLLACLAPAVGEPGFAGPPPGWVVAVLPPAGVAELVPPPSQAVSTTARTAADALIAAARRTVPGLWRSDFVDGAMAILSVEEQRAVPVAGTNDFRPIRGCRGHQVVAGS
ncbi:hypothetical protein [Streptomyces sp. NPDC049915]|uniref:hypothetical protein n=1 Tax=Streptomyces sp. NPDC049915 TaxID=3155510 RepID=UPI003430FF6C